jgi:hypothetical protein
VVVMTTAVMVMARLAIIASAPSAHDLILCN